MEKELKVLDGLKDKQDPGLLQLLIDLKKMRERLDFMIEYEQIQAKVLKAKYDALIKEGFNVIQALELCKK